MMKGNMWERPIRAQVGQVILDAICALDMTALDDALGPEIKYDGDSKAEFLAKLQKVVDMFRKLGDTRLVFYPGQCDCEFCNYEEPGFAFVGSSSGYYLHLMLNVKKGVVKDLFECRIFQVPDMELTKGKRLRLL